MKQRASDSGRDGDQIALAGENFDLASPGEFEEIDGAAIADAGHREFVGGYRGHVWQQFARVDEEFK